MLSLVFVTVCLSQEESVGWRQSQYQRGLIKSLRVAQAEWNHRLGHCCSHTEWDSLSADHGIFYFLRNFFLGTPQSWLTWTTCLGTTRAEEWSYFPYCQALSPLGACRWQGFAASLMHNPKISSLGDSLTCCLLFWGGSQTIDSTKNILIPVLPSLHLKGFLKKPDFYLECISWCKISLCGSCYCMYFAIAIGSYPWHNKYRTHWVFHNASRPVAPLLLGDTEKVT